PPRPHPALSRRRFADRRGGGIGAGAGRGGAIAQGNDLYPGEQRLERPAEVGAVGGGERREQPPVERAREGHDFGLRGPLPRELERALVCLGARVAKERLAMTVE